MILFPLQDVNAPVACIGNACPPSLAREVHRHRVMDVERQLLA